MLQFLLEEQVLEFHFYMSMLWSATVLVTASTVCELCPRGLLTRRAWQWIPATAIVLVPIALGPLHRHVTMRLGTGLVIAGFVILAVFLLVTRGGVDPRHVSPRQAPSCLSADFSLLVGQAPNSSLRRGQVAFPKPLYGEVFGAGNDAAQDLYTVISEIDEVVPKPVTSGCTQLMWTGLKTGRRAGVHGHDAIWVEYVLRGSRISGT